jgi:S-DNA-T family DNA segregation ATPase FtsK/SpoIIIE
MTYTLAHISIEDYGFRCRIYAPWGLALEDLEKIRLKIESGLKCNFLFTIPEHKQFAMVDIVKPEQVKCNDMPFSPQKVKPYELYAGINIKGEPIIFNVNLTPHCLLAGQTRKGKNGALDHMLTSLIYSCNEKEIELYLLQCAKADLIKYQHCKQVRCCTLGNLEEMLSALQYINDVEIENRNKLMQPMIAKLQGDNVFDYNNLHPKDQLLYIYIVVDEIMVLMLESKDKEIKEMKESILYYLERIAEFGGALGVTYIACHQIPEAKLMPTFLKNMSLIRICFGFDDDICGRIVLGDKYGDLVLKLPARRAYYSADGKVDLMFTTNLKGRIEQFIKPSFKLGHITVFDVIKGFKKTNPTINTIQTKDSQTTSGKLPPQDYSKVNKSLDEILEENIKKIPGFVPYNPVTFKSKDGDTK